MLQNAQEKSTVCLTVRVTGKPEPTVKWFRSVRFYRNAK